MITHEIKKPVPPTLFQRAASHLRSIPSNHRRVQNETYWGKYEYTKWLEDKVRPVWKKDTLCTVKAMVEADRIPVPLFKVYELQEVHWMAPVADAVNEPRAIVLVSMVAASFISYPPSLLRKLTEKELELVRLRDHPPEVTKKPDAVTVNEQGEFVRVSGENGEIVERYSG